MISYHDLMQQRQIESLLLNTGLRMGKAVITNAGFALGGAIAEKAVDKLVQFGDPADDKHRATQIHLARTEIQEMQKTMKTTEESTKERLEIFYKNEQQAEKEHQDRVAAYRAEIEMLKQQIAEEKARKKREIAELMSKSTGSSPNIPSRPANSGVPKPV